MRHPAAESTGKIAFANQLRGVAVLCVIVVHYFGIYWGGRELVAQYVFAPVLAGENPGILRHIAPPTFNFGPFGVALFFLISGFVIPFSLEKLGSWRFLAARALRIYPSYWVASALMLLACALSAAYWHVPFHADGWRLFTNLLLFNAELGQSSIDMVNWTLSIEVKFYVAAVLLWPLLRRAPMATLAAYASLVFVSILLLPDRAAAGQTTLFIDFAKLEAMYTVYLFIGTLFHFAIKGKLGLPALAVGAIAMYTVFFLMWPHTVALDQYWQVTANYGYALVVFALCYAFRARFRPMRLLDFFAAISYPLYLVHAVSGYVLMRILMDLGLPYLAALPLTFCVVVIVATLLHYAIELPTASAGKKLHRVLDK